MLDYEGSAFFQILAFMIKPRVNRLEKQKNNTLRGMAGHFQIV